MRKKPRFTHIRANLRGDVSGKRFNTHAMERNVARIGEGECGNDKWMEIESGEDGKCVWSEMWDCAGWQMWGKDTGHNKSSRAGGANGAVVQGHGTSQPGIT